ncbi:Flp pilus assembly protein CpaB [Oligella ureolytica]|uniref:Flp pilus assembly protein CpaB n=1 Tax=Oligella ureolytica TaxID=90244 RepID=A0A378X9K9_9BURK|nr:Flp pilus assembly protein CpaB [Oligella ureolytica]QPT40095.1 Flp pilus assembly protein CpaB [Oligella ureolytica]SUA50156.1 Flp pilus assembly protein CpaB [Oligella ureolytica]SUA51624.1 Flp pilus assembly protein CpaB [Oligella ureolytica]
MKIRMNKKATIVISLAIVAGLIAAWSAQQYISEKVEMLEEQARVETVPRVVAAYDLPEGTKIDAIHVAVREVPKEWVASGSILPDEFIHVEGQVVTAALKRGDQLLWANTAQLKNKPFSDKINPGRRAVTIPVDTINSVSGMLVPGDLIDLYVSFEYRRKQITAPLLQGVLVMATGQQSRVGQDPKDSASRYSTVTLDTAPEEAAKLVAARQAGTITALLRNPEDDKVTQKGVRGDLANMLGIATPPPPIKRKPQVVYGNQNNKKLPNLAVNPATENTNRDERGVFELPDQEDLVSAWINTLPSVDINDVQTLSNQYSDEEILLIE